MLFDGEVKSLSTALAIACLLLVPLTAEVVIEYDAEKKGYPEGLENLDDESVDEGVCIVAGADVPMGDAYDEGLFGQLFVHPIRYAVAGDKDRSAAIKPLPLDNQQALNVITVTVGQTGISAFVLVVQDPDKPPVPPEQHISIDEGEDKQDEFNRFIQASMAKSKKAGEVPRAALVVSSTTSYGKMVDTLKMIQAAGCHHAAVVVNDHIAAFNDIVVKTDPEILPPVAQGADLQKNKEGRIVVNVRNNGTYTAEDFTILPDENAIQAYVQKAREDIEKLGITPRLHLRGDKEAMFKHGRTAVRAAAAAGVNQVLFATFIRDPDQKKPAPKPPQAQQPPRQPLPDKKLPGPRPGGPGLLQKGYDGLSSQLKPRESDLNLQLPGPAAESDKEPEGEPFLIRIEGKGRIFVGEVELDKDPNVRELPLLTKALEFYKKGVDAVGEKPLVQIYATDEAMHQRVIDVLNALAGVGINSVTFTDLTEEIEKEEK